MDEHPRLLTRGQQALLADERALLVELRTALARYGAADDDQAALDRSIRQLDELFLVVVVGEFNAGKSAVINELVGADVLEEGVTQTTARLRRSLEKVRTSIEPYSRFVRAEREHLVEARAALEGLSRGLDALRARVEST